MQADQAAGLRRNQARRRTQVVTVFSAQSGWAFRLAQALHTHGARVLLVDTTGRQATASNTQFIFNWQAQVARQYLQPVPLSGIDTLHAPGALPGSAAIVQASGRWDSVLFDGGQIPSTALTLDASVAQTVVLEVGVAPEMLCHSYALVKTLYLNPIASRVMLCGEAALCERLVAATRHFLSARLDWLETVTLEPDAHLTALAAKISAAETGAGRFYNNAAGEGLHHG